MKIIQVMPTVSFGDAVSNDARAIRKVISEMGYDTGIYAENIDSRLKDPFIHKLSKLPSLKSNDIVIFNHSTGTDLCYKLEKMGGRKMMIYHNITPPEFFEPYSPISAKLTAYGYEGTEHLSDKIDYVMAVSEYNASELRRMGYGCEMFIRPILIPFDDYKKEPDKDILENYRGDGYKNIVFVGRIAPNKKQEDIIATFAYYKKHIEPKSRLILVGSDGGMERYSSALKRYASALMTDDIIFTGQVSFSKILAYYRVADAFLCMSEHEGFGVPLAEAMFFDVPIMAFDSSAIAETLGGSGVLFREKDPIFCAMLLDRVLKDEKLRGQLIDSQRRRLADFEYSVIRERFIEGLNRFICRKLPRH